MKFFKTALVAFVSFQSVWGAASTMTQDDFALIAINGLSPECRSSMGLKEMASRSIIVEPGYQDCRLIQYQGILTTLRQADAQGDDQSTLGRRERTYVMGLFEEYINLIKLYQEHKVINLFLPLNYNDGSLLDPLTFIFNALNSLVLLNYDTYIIAERLRSYVEIAPLIPAVIQEVKRQIELYGDEACYPYIKMIDDILNADRAKNVFDALEKMLPTQTEMIAKLREQVAAYNTFVAESLLPHASQSCVLPRDIYLSLLRLNGITETPEKLIERGKVDFAIHYEGFKYLANYIAMRQSDPIKFPEDKPGVVLQSLIEQTGSTDVDTTIKLYHRIQDTLMERLKGLKFVTLPEHPVTIRSGTAAEEAIFPVPHVNAPNFIGNKGDQWPEFVLCDVVGNSSPAVAFALTAHEGCPGHVLQYSRMVEETAAGKMNLIQTTLASNATNAEGWAHYVEYPLSKTYEPTAKLGAIRDQLLRMARMFLDPQVNLGIIGWDDVVKFHKEILGYKDSTPESEAMRYTYYIQGQAPSYRFGAVQIESLKAELEGKAADFTIQKFHDTILSFGLLPLSLVNDLVEQAMLE